MKIATVAVYVDDQKKAEEFWTKKVGLVIHSSHEMGPDAKWIELAAKGSESCLVIYPKSMMNNWAQHRPSIVFESEDLKKDFEEMSARGVNFTQPLKQMPWGPFAMFEDEDGNQFGMRQRK